MSELQEQDKVRLQLVQLFKHFGGSKLPVTEAVFTEYCNKEGIKNITLEQYSDRLLDFQEDMVIRETLPHIFNILAAQPDLHITDYDMKARTDEVAGHIKKASGEIAHLLKRADVPYQRHGDVMFTMSRLVNAILDQATETNRRDVEGVIEDMAAKKFGREMTMADVAEYNAELKNKG